MISGRILLVAAVCSLALFSQCKKEKTENPAPASNPQRVSTIQYSINDGPAVRGNYQYDGTKLTGYLVTDDSTGQIAKMELAYTGDQIGTLTYYEIKDGSWKMRIRMEAGGYTGSNPGEIISRTFLDDGQEWAEKARFFYDGSRLVRKESWLPDGAGWFIYKYIFYSYDPKGRIVKKSDTSGNYGTITTFTYDAERMISAMEQDYYAGSLDYSTKTDYSYTGDKLTKVSEYGWMSGTWQLYSEMNYTYNDRGNLHTEDYTVYGPYSFTYHSEFIYSDGQGNFRSYVKLMSEDLFLPGEPSPVPAGPGTIRTGFAHTPPSPGEKSAHFFAPFAPSR